MLWWICVIGPRAGHFVIYGVLIEFLICSFGNILQAFSDKLCLVLERDSLLSEVCLVILII